MPINLLMRRIHRFFSIITILTGFIMAITGVMLKYALGDTGFARYIHNNISIIFTIVLVIMMITGVYLYFLPWLMKRKQAKSMKQTNSTS